MITCDYDYNIIALADGNCYCASDTHLKI